VRGLLVDFGGVLTSNVFESFRDFCVAEGLDANAFLDVFRNDPDARRELRRLETGEVDEAYFEPLLARRLGIANHEGLIDRLFAGMKPDGAMVGAVKKAKSLGIKTGLLSNSMGAGRYDRASFPEMFDGVVISGEVGFHKPQPERLRIELLVARRVGGHGGKMVNAKQLHECLGPQGRFDV
jgi:putative hydrolase of the HAD superfamily